MQSSECNQENASKWMQTSETKWIQAIDAAKWLQPIEFNQLNLTNWMQPGESNKNRNRWMQQNGCNKFGWKPKMNQYFFSTHLKK